MIDWICPSCQRTTAEGQSCGLCRKWDEIPDFSGNMPSQSQDQAVLHDTKGAKINIWPRDPVTVNQAQRERWFRRLRNLKRGRVLEIGCHRSGVLKTFSDLDWEVAGIDVSRQSVEDQNSLQRGHFAVAPAESIPLQPASVDLILAIHVLEHVDDLHRALEEVHRILKPQGRIFIEIPVKDFGFSWERFRYSRDPERWKKAAAKAGHLWEKLPQALEFKALLLEKKFDILTEERGWVWLAPLYERGLRSALKLRNKVRGNQVSVDPTLPNEPAEVEKERNHQTLSCETASLRAKPKDPHGKRIKFFRRSLSAFVRGLDRLDHQLVPNRHHGATALYLCQKRED